MTPTGPEAAPEHRPVASEAGTTSEGMPATADERQLATFAVNSYRYLRLAIVVVVVSLMVSVLIERLHVSCWQGSISAYYYTPVHTMFLGALIAIGVCLIAIKGSTDKEDVLLNLAGVLAPIVAFVPTSPPTSNCTSSAFAGGDAEAAIDNNLLAFAIGGAVAIAIAYAISRKVGRTQAVPQVDPRSRTGLLFALAMLVVGLIWYYGFRDNFLAHAHGGAAVLMFVIIGVVMFFNARSARTPFRPIYWGTLAAMVVAALAVFIGKLVDGDWRHQILWLEIFELLPFTVYWAAQTAEHWAGGVPTGHERSDRAVATQLKVGAGQVVGAS